MKRIEGPKTSYTGDKHNNRRLSKTNGGGSFVEKRESPSKRKPVDIKISSPKKAIKSPSKNK